MATVRDVRVGALGLALGLVLGAGGVGLWPSRPGADPGWLDALVAERGWHHVPATAHPAEGRLAFYLSREPRTAADLRNLPALPERLDRWGGVVLVVADQPGQVAAMPHGARAAGRTVFGDPDMMAAVVRALGGR